jgi:hypothetical protein
MGNNTTGFGEAIDLLRGLHRRMTQNLTAATKMNGVRIRDAAVRRITEGDPSWAPNSPLTIARKRSSKPLVDHGDLRMAFRLLPAGPGRLFVGVPRAAQETGRMSLMRIMTVQEFGVTINPRKARMLAIPVSLEADRLIRQYGSIRNIPGLFRPRGAGGRRLNILCVKGSRAGGRPTVLFVLKDKVVIPPRPVIGPVIKQEWPKCIGRWEAAARAALQGKDYLGQSA